MDSEFVFLEILGSLKDIREKVHREVELAVQLDEHMLQSLESNSKNASFTDELGKMSPVAEDLKQILLKVLQGGFQVITDGTLGYMDGLWSKLFFILCCLGIKWKGKVSAARILPFIRRLYAS